MSHETLQRIVKKTRRSALPIILAASSIGCAVPNIKGEVIIPNCNQDPRPKSYTVGLYEKNPITVGKLKITAGNPGELDWIQITPDNIILLSTKQKITFKDDQTGRLIDITAKKAPAKALRDTDLTINSSCRSEK